MLSDAMKQAISDLPAILSTIEVADFLNVSYLTIYRLVRRKEIAAYKDDEGDWCILQCDLKKYCSKNCNL
jgi:excisionase family DNA binding protein